MGKFVIEHPDKDRYYFNLKADNWKIILTSEQYTTKTACKDGINSVKENAEDDKNYTREKSKDGKYYFTLKAANGKVIGTSEMYETEAGRDNGIESVKENAPDAQVED